MQEYADSAMVVGGAYAMKEAAALQAQRAANQITSDRPHGALDNIADRLATLIDDLTGQTISIASVCDRAGLNRDHAPPQDTGANLASKLAPVPTALTTINDRIDRLFSLASDIGDLRRRIDKLA